METGFIRGNSYNLPKIDSLMVARYFVSRKDLLAAEFNNDKRASRVSYGDDAIGFVQLKRDSNLCTIKCRVGVNKVQMKQYSVTIIVDEKKYDVISSQCHDCAMSEGSCIHVVAFVLWLHRRSEDPSYIQAKCYWRKSQPSKIGSTLKFITASELANVIPSTSSDTHVFDKFVKQAIVKEVSNCELLKYLKQQEL